MTGAGMSGSLSREVLHRLPVLGVQEVLEALEPVQPGTSPSAEGVLVTLFLRSGHSLIGYLVGRSPENQAGRARPGEPMVLIHCADVTGRRDDALSYVRAASIEALTVHRASQALEALSGGEIEAPPAGEVPTRLGVSRRCEVLTKRLEEGGGGTIALSVVWEGMPREELALHSLSELMNETVSSLIQIYGENGPEILPRTLEGVRFEEGSVAGVSRHGNVLIVSAAFSRGKAGRLSGATLVKALEAVL